MLPLVSCGNPSEKSGNPALQPSGAAITSDDTEILPDPDCDNLTSYYETTFYVNGMGDTCILGYNYKSHELDFLNLSTGKLGQSISLDRDGPDGIAGMPIWFHQIAVDSILVGNDQQTVYLIDTIGRVVNSYSFRGEGHATASRNARSHIAAFRYDGDAGQIIYPRENDKDLSIAALDTASEATTAIASIPGWTRRKVGFLIYPNVAYTDTSALVNFPYESKITELSLLDGRIIRQSDSPMTSMTAETVDPGESVEEIVWRSYANPFYANVNYLPASDIFAQIVIAPTGSSRNDDDNHKAYDRKLYLRVFDRNLKPIHEHEFESGKYLPYAWTFTPDGVILYRDHPLDQNNDSEGVRLTRFRIAPVYSD